MGSRVPPDGVPAVPLHGQSPLVTGERGASPRGGNKLPRHRPLSRTQSSPLPQSPQALPHGPLQHHFLDKQQVQLGKVGLGLGGCGVRGVGCQWGWEWEWGGFWVVVGYGYGNGVGFGVLEGCWGQWGIAEPQNATGRGSVSRGN